MSLKITVVFRVRTLTHALTHLQYSTHHGYSKPNNPPTHPPAPPLTNAHHTAPRKMTFGLGRGRHARSVDAGKLERAVDHGLVRGEPRRRARDPSAAPSLTSKAGRTLRFGRPRAAVAPNYAGSGGLVRQSPLNDGDCRAACAWIGWGRRCRWWHQCPALVVWGGGCSCCRERGSYDLQRGRWCGGGGGRGRSGVGGVWWLWREGGREGGREGERERERGGGV